MFPHEPLVRVQGPIVQCQFLESLILNVMNFQTLIATKAARICQAARDQPVLEFGLRRAQGVDGALAASRAAYVGGCEGTSNVLAGKLFGIPVRGTHAHSWVMSFDEELEAFLAFARADAEQLHPAGGYLRHAGRSSQGSRSWKTSARTGTQTCRDSSGFRRPGLSQH